jgi:hypothetical protein
MSPPRHYESAKLSFNATVSGVIVANPVVASIGHVLDHCGLVEVGCNAFLLDHLLNLAV